MCGQLGMRQRVRSAGDVDNYCVRVRLFDGYGYGHGHGHGHGQGLLHEHVIANGIADGVWCSRSVPASDDPHARYTHLPIEASGQRASDGASRASELCTVLHARRCIRMHDTIASSLTLTLTPLCSFPPSSRGAKSLANCTCLWLV